MAPLCSHPPSHKLSSRVKVPLFPEKDSPIDLNIKAFVGRPGRQVHTRTLYMRKYMHMCDHFM